MRSGIKEVKQPEGNKLMPRINHLLKQTHIVSDNEKLI